jgi:hypothetical protein
MAAPVDPGVAPVVAERNGASIRACEAIARMVRGDALIQDEGVQRPPSRTAPAALAALAILAGCAHTREEVQTSSGLSEIAPAPIAPRASDREVIAVDATPPPPPEPAATARPRLSQTITLGQGGGAQYTPERPQPPPGAAPAPGVVVNNTIVVEGQPRYYGGGYAGYGGYRSGGGGWGRPTGAADARVGRGAGGPSAWGATGWEGARRTAAPGQTPGVGGNWSPPPSYGPAPMR